MRDVLLRNRLSGAELWIGNALAHPHTVAVALTSRAHVTGAACPPYIDEVEAARVHWQYVLRSGYGMQQCLGLLQVGRVKALGEPA